MKVIDFKPRSHLEAAAQLDAFISWARMTLVKGVDNKWLNPGLQWDMPSWHQGGIKGCSFTACMTHQGNNAEVEGYMQKPFMDFAKALVVHQYIFRRKSSVDGILRALKLLEVALLEYTGSVDVTKLSSTICDTVAANLRLNFCEGNTAYLAGCILERIVKLMVDKKILVTPFKWKSPLRYKSRTSLKEQRENHDKKLPSRESILALGELFNNDLSSPLDIVTVSACALLLSQPSRIGELADVEHDCVLFKESAEGSQRMFLRWYAEKGFGATTKPVFTGMEPAVERVIRLLAPITDEARSYAGWLEDHPDEFPPHKDLPMKGRDDPLSYEEACAALKLQTGKHKLARNKFRNCFLVPLAKRAVISPNAQAVLDEIEEGWDHSLGKPVFVNGKRKSVRFDDRAILTLRKLNILLREKYLPKTFPYTTPPQDGKKRIKYRDALFTVRTGMLPDETSSAVALPHDFGVEIAANPLRIGAQLGGAQTRQSIFQRHGYGDIRVNTHAFRHELNTEMHRAGLSQLLIDAFSGRTTRGSVYNHVTVEERARAIAAVHPKTKPGNPAQCLEKIKTNQPLKLSDVTDLVAGGQDRVIHSTHLGICVHSFASEPCPKMGACLTCGNLGCVKGDDVKLSNLKGERAYLQQRYDKAIAAESSDTLGAANWRKKAGLDLFKCDALIKVLESPELSNGDIVWNIDNGWNLTKNAVVMAGLLDEKDLEAPMQESLASLEELAAMQDEIEV